MTQERRQHPRVVRPFDGSFSGGSGATGCRIADISLGGCFVQSLAMPGPGEAVSIGVTIGGEVLELSGVVVYVESTMGFSVRFTDTPPAVLDDLRRLLKALEQGEAPEGS